MTLLAAKDVEFAQMNLNYRPIVLAIRLKFEFIYAKFPPFSLQVSNLTTGSRQGLYSLENEYAR